MDLARYTEDIQKLINEGELFSIERRRGAIRKLNSLKKKGVELNDDVLQGFAYYHTAIWYYENGEYTKFFKNLREAIYHLLRTDDHELLARCYNIFGIYAQYNDMFDVAYSSYMNAKQFIGDEDSPVRGIIIGNLSNLYYEMGDHKQASIYMKQSRELINNGKDDVLYHRNMLIAYTSEGLNSIAKGDIKAAERAAKNAEKMYMEANPNILQYSIVSYKFFKARLALVKNNVKEAEKEIDEIVDNIKSDDTFEYNFEYVNDINSFCKDIMNKKYKKMIGKIIDSVEEGMGDYEVVHARRLICETKSDYYRLINDEEGLIESLEEQHRIWLRQRKEQKRIYRFSLELVKLIDELREDELNVRSENESLHVQVVTDALTNIPNRHALDIELANRFEDAYKYKKSLGVEIFDVNDFKDFNDDYGHQVGDKCLETIGGVLQELSKKYNFYCARYGGDEFVVIYDNLSDTEIKKITKEIDREISNKEIDGATRKIKQAMSVSQGVCNSAPKIKSKIWDYLSEADKALYEAKDYYKKNKNNKTIIRKLPEIFS